MRISPVSNVNYPGWGLFITSRRVGSPRVSKPRVSSLRSAIDRAAIGTWGSRVLRGRGRHRPRRLVVAGLQSLPSFFYIRIESIDRRLQVRHPGPTPGGNLRHNHLSDTLRSYHRRTTNSGGRCTRVDQGERFHKHPLWSVPWC